MKASVGIDKNTLIFAGAVLVGGYYVLNRFGQATGIVDSKGDRDRQAELSQDYWSPAYYNQFPKGTKFVIPSDAKAEAFCKRLWDADGYLSNDDPDVVAVIKEMKSKAYLSRLCDYWINTSPYVKQQSYFYYGTAPKSLLAYLQKFLKDESWSSIRSIMNSKPNYV
jgi:hypothetical protein